MGVYVYLSKKWSVKTHNSLFGYIKSGLDFVKEISVVKSEFLSKYKIICSVKISDLSNIIGAFDLNTMIFSCNIYLPLSIGVRTIDIILPRLIMK
jgi:hypothetical protein